MDKLWSQHELEQIERLRSEDTPTAALLPILLSHIGSQVKTTQSQSYKEFDKNPFFFKFTCDTPSEVAW